MRFCCAVFHGCGIWIRATISSAALFFALSAKREEGRKRGNIFRRKFPMTETLLPIVQKINGYLSDYILVALLIAVGLWYSIKTRFAGPSLQGGLEQRVRQPQSPRRKAGERHELLPGARHRHCGVGRHRHYRRSVRRDPHRRPRRHLLNVGHRLPRHGDHLRGSHARAGNAHRG